MRQLTRTATLGATLVLAPLIAHAGEPRAHDGGFFLRLSSGAGHGVSRVEDRFDEIEFRGPSAAFDVAAGAVVARNLALHLTLGGWGLVDPTVEFDGLEEDADDVELGMGMVGGGVTYYLGESNVYVTVSAGAAVMGFELDGGTGHSDAGFAVEAGVGKEWWVSDRWGLGVSGTVGFHDVPPGDSSANFEGRTVAVRFSATFN